MLTPMSTILRDAIAEILSADGACPVCDQSFRPRKDEDTYILHLFPNTSGGWAMLMYHAECFPRSKSKLVVDVHDPAYIQGTRAILDGVDISDDCYRAELFPDGRMRAHCFKRNEAGQHYLEAGDIAREIREGCGRFLFLGEAG